MNLVKTLKECKRVLKKNGIFIIVDRAHNNSTPDSEIERMLNIVYDENFLTKFYRPKGTILTRKEKRRVDKYRLVVSYNRVGERFLKSKPHPFQIAVQCSELHMCQISVFHCFSKCKPQVSVLQRMIVYLAST